MNDVSNQPPSHLSAALKGAFTGSAYGARSDAASAVQTVNDTSEWQQATYGRNRTYQSAPRAEVADAPTAGNGIGWNVFLDPNRYRNTEAAALSNPSQAKLTDSQRRFPKIRAYVST